MPKIVCVKDHIQCEVIKVGVEVIDMFSDPPQPYKITPADAYKCPVCGIVILAGFAEGSTFRHDPHFDEKLSTLKESDLEKAGWVINVYERIEDVTKG
jgi:hypothetical protein